MGGMSRPGGGDPEAGSAAPLIAPGIGATLRAREGRGKQERLNVFGVGFDSPPGRIRADRERWREIAPAARTPERENADG